MTTVTYHLAKFATTLVYDGIPEEVIIKAKECIMDTIGAALAAVQAPDIKGITAEIKKYDKQNDCTLWGTTEKSSVFNAALINGIMAHTVELDDVHKRSKSHAGTVVIPAAISLGEFQNISGKKLLEALVVGYEVMLRIGMGIGPSSHRLKGWHATSTCGTFGAAAAAAKILDLDFARTLSAYGIAGTQSSGLWAFTEDGATNKKFHPGHAAYCGIMSSILAAGGMTGSRSIIEAPDGGLFKASSDEYNYDLVVEGLGEKFEILNVDRKPYACCRSMHPSIDAVLELRQEHDIDPHQVKDVEVHTYEIAIKQCGFTTQPQNVFESKFSIPYGVAVALFDGQALIDQFSEVRIKDSELHDLASKVQVISSKRFTEIYPEHWGCELKLRTYDDKEYSKIVMNPKGDTQNPLSREELIAKFNTLSAPVIPSNKQHHLVDRVFNLEKADSVFDIIELLVF